jgi:hypothetical protein
MLYITPIVVRGNEADARRGTSLDLILQARARSVRKVAVLTLANLEKLL